MHILCTQSVVKMYLHIYDMCMRENLQSKTLLVLSDPLVALIFRGIWDES